MSADLKKMKEDVIHSFELINTGDLMQVDKAIDEMYAPDAVLHYPHAPNLPPGAAGIKQFTHQLYKDFTNIHLMLDDMFGEGDELACRYTWQATNASTGKKTNLPLLNIGRWDGGKIVEEWEVAGPSTDE
jgi:predicted SnoaL-like aldol condensation-catalyzing enzyme